MNTGKLFKQYMLPFMDKSGFKLHDSNDGMYVFKHMENSELWVIFRISITRNYMYVDIRREYKENWSGYNLQLFLDDPDLPDKTINQPWYFDTEEEFIGALEEQARLLEMGGFDWLHGHSNYDIEHLVDESADKRAFIWQNSTEIEREVGMIEYRNILNRWKKRRVKPVLWVSN